MKTAPSRIYRILTGSRVGKVARFLADETYRHALFKLLPHADTEFLTNHSEFTTADTEFLTADSELMDADSELMDADSETAVARSKMAIFAYVFIYNLTYNVLSLLIIKYLT